MNSGYFVIEKFSPKDKDAWTKYIEFSNLSHLKEVITLDGCLCPSGINLYEENDYTFVNWIDDGYCGAAVYTSLEWVLERVKQIESKQVIFIWYEPNENGVNNFLKERFTFCGFDLVDHLGGISALLNCEGFESVLSKNDLSSQGLITNYFKARETQELLREKYPDEEHAHCQLWAIWRYEN